MVQAINNPEIIKVCSKILMECKKAIESNSYQKLLDVQNGKWEKCFNTEKQTLPVMGINIPELIKRINVRMNERSGLDIELTHVEKDKEGNILSSFTLSQQEKMLRVFPLPSESCDIKESLGKYISDKSATYFNRNDKELDAEIEMSIKNGEHTEDFINRISRDRRLFEIQHDEQEQFIYLDIFYTALEKRLNDVQKVCKIQDDYKKSIYMNPDFLYLHLNDFFSFSNQSPVIISESAASELFISTSNITKESQIIKYPLNDNNSGNDILMNYLDDALLEYPSSRHPSKVIKPCYPLYFFICNNILESINIQPKSKVSNIDGCKFANPCPDLRTIKDALKIRIKSYKYKKIDPNNDYRISTQVYAFKKFYDYLSRIIDKNMNDGAKDKAWTKKFHLSPDYIYKIKRKEGNSKNATEKRIDVTCDMNLTAWLFIRYSDLFKIALMTQIEPFFSDEKFLENELKKCVLWPQNFFTTLNFNTLGFRSYPSFYREYNKFIRKSGESLYKDFKNLELDEWIAVSQRFQREAFYIRWAELRRVDDIFQKFFTSIHLTIENNSYHFDKEIFKRYLRMKRTIDELQINEK